MPFHVIFQIGILLNFRGIFSVISTNQTIDWKKLMLKTRNTFSSSHLYFCICRLKAETRSVSIRGPGILVTPGHHDHHYTPPPPRMSVQSNILSEVPRQQGRSGYFATNWNDSWSLIIKEKVIDISNKMAKNISKSFSICHRTYFCDSIEIYIFPLFLQNIHPCFKVKLAQFHKFTETIREGSGSLTLSWSISLSGRGPGSAPWRTLPAGSTSPGSFSKRTLSSSDWALNSYSSLISQIWD